MRSALFILALGFLRISGCVEEGQPEALIPEIEAPDAPPEMETPEVETIEESTDDYFSIEYPSDWQE